MVPYSMVRLLRYIQKVGVPLFNASGVLPVEDVDPAFLIDGLRFLVQYAAVYAEVSNSSDDSTR